MVFEKINEILKIRGNLKPVTPLRIGAQIAEYSTARAPVLLFYNAQEDSYYPFIPGSSLKGVLRHGCERIANTHGFGKKIVESLFGGEEHGSKILVRDGVSKNALVEERPHFGRAGGKGNFFEEEYVFSENFQLSIDIINPEKEELKLLFMCLMEFDYFRLHIGGGVSRGYGFVNVEIKETKKATVKNLESVEEKIEEEYLRGVDLKCGKRENGKGFGYYAYANDDDLHGCIVVKFEVECLTNFCMRGSDEKIITCAGYEVIPGSTIKGFLRHNWNANKVDDIFGSTKGHASRIIISDAIGNNGPVEAGYIPKGDKLLCLVVFDNMEKEDIEKILKLLCKKEGVKITGNTSAFRNIVKFTPLAGWKYTLKNPKQDVLGKIKEVIK
ncbi:MAG: RAMP superfamily CRISPR-associated protein [Thermoplasmata archaeon]